MTKKMFLSLVICLWFVTISATANAAGEGLASARSAPDTLMASVKAFGARGDGVTDDTGAIQAAIDQVGKEGGTLFFSPGTYMVTTVGLRPGIHFQGYGATLKRPPKQGKFTRTFDANRAGYLYSGDSDSPPITIEGLTFDGNRVQQGKYENYELEQASLIFLRGDGGKAGRLQTRIVNCSFKECVGDAISIYNNVDAQIINCTAENCFRGGMVIIGGYSRVQVTNFTAYGKVHSTGIDVEVDGPGYRGSVAIELLINGMMLPDGDFDVCVLGDSTVLGTNIYARQPFSVCGTGTAQMRFSNCTFGNGVLSNQGNRIVWPGQVTFENCRFVVDALARPEKPASWAAISILWSTGNDFKKNQLVRLVNCDFAVAPGIRPEDTTHAVMVNSADSPAFNNRLVMIGGTISPDYDYGIHLSHGGKALVKDVQIGAQTALFLGGGGDYPFDITVDGVQLEKNSVYANIVSGDPANRITHRNVLLEESQNVLKTQYGLAKNQYQGGRAIVGKQPPTPATHGLVNDMYRIDSPRSGRVYEWICTQSGCGQGAVWKPLIKVGD